MGQSAYWVVVARNSGLELDHVAGEPLRKRWMSVAAGSGTGDRKLRHRAPTGIIVGNNVEKTEGNE
jgi:hypothetical protein